MLRIEDLKAERMLLLEKLQALDTLIVKYDTSGNYAAHVIKTRTFARSTANVPYQPRQKGSVGTSKLVVLCLGKHPGGLTASQITDKFMEAKLFPKLDRRVMMSRIASVIANKITQGAVERNLAGGVVTLTEKGKEEYKHHTGKS